MTLNHLNLRVRDAVACRDFYLQHFGFTPAFEAEGGYFMRDEAGFLLAVIPVDEHQPLPSGFHIGFGRPTPESVVELHEALRRAGATTTEIEARPGEDYVTFRCWDPDGTEVEVFWEGST